MGRPSSTPDFCRGLHSDLQRGGLDDGDILPRDTWRKLVMLTANVSLAQERNITLEGEVLGLWRRHRSPSNREDRVEFLATQLALSEIDPLVVPA